MHKCKNCATEFEGKFCPECGTKWRDFDICPSCGSKIEGAAKFCNECGYSLTAEKPNTKQSVQSRQTQSQSGAQLLSKIYKVVRYLPTVLYALYSLLLFAFFAAPIGYFDLGGLFGSGSGLGNLITSLGGSTAGLSSDDSSLGSLYAALNGNTIIDGISGTVQALLVFAVIAVIVAIGFLAKMRSAGYALTAKPTVFFCIVYLLFVIMSAVLMGQISAFDSGSGLVHGGMPEPDTRICNRFCGVECCFGNSLQANGVYINAVGTQE